MKFNYMDSNHQHKEFDLDLNELSACPGCGHVPTEDEIEDSFIYPMNRERTLWYANCTHQGSGCGWSVLAGSPEEALNVWNKRVHIKHFSKHDCKRPSTCSCNLQAMEPNEKCPVHGYGEFPPRCEVCGKYMKWSQ